MYFDAVAADYGVRSSAGLWSLVREIEREAVLCALGPRAGERVIDAGCGAGFYGRALLERGCDVLGIDASAEMARVAREQGLRTIHARIEDAEPDSRSADALVCAGALEFCEDLSPVLLQFFRWLKPGGRAVLLYPSGILSRGYQLYHRLHNVRAVIRCEGDIGGAARDAGFDVEFTRGAGPLARCMGLAR